MNQQLMTAAFQTALPSTQKLVLVALCLAAGEEGASSVGIPALQTQCSLSERAVRQSVTCLETAGHIRREFKSGGATTYWVTPAPDAPLHQMHPCTTCTPAPRAPRNNPNTELAVIGTPIEPKPKVEKFVVAKALPDVSPQVVLDWVKLREKKKMVVTETAIEGVRKEANKAGLSMQRVLEICCSMGWAGFNRNWDYPDKDADQKAASRATGKHSGFKAKNYSEGIAEDGTIL